MEKESYFFQMGIVMKESGDLVLCMGRVYIIGKMVKNMKDSI